MTDADRDGVYEFTTDDIPAGNWEFKVAHGQSLGRELRRSTASVTGANIPLTVAAGQVVTFKYTLSTHRVDGHVRATRTLTPPTASADAEPGGARLDRRLRRAGHGHAVRRRTSPRGPSRSSTASTVARGRPYTAPFQVTAAGSHTVEYRATDAAGNVSAVASKTFTITARSRHAEQPIVGNVPATLSVTLGASPSFGTFEPNVAPRLPGLDDRDGDQHGRRRDAQRGRPQRHQHGQAGQRQLRPGAAAAGPGGRAAPSRRSAARASPTPLAHVRRAGQRHERADRAQAVDRRAPTVSGPGPTPRR